MPTRSCLEPRGAYSLLSSIAVTLTALFALGATGCESSATPPHEDHGRPEGPIGLQSQADFTNGGFETGTLNGWTVTTKKNGSTNGNGTGITTFPPITLSDLNLVNGGTNLTAVVNSGTSGYPIPAGLTSADSLRYPFVGNDSVVINPQGNNTNANVLTQSVVMTASDVDPADGNIHLRFAVAPVLNNPTHVANQQPYFFIEIRNTTKNTQLFSTFNFANQPGVAWKTAAVTPASGAVLYTDWQAFDVAPGPAGIAIGDTVSATLVAAGCAFTAHWGELYVDQFGTAFPLPNVNVSAPAFSAAGTTLTYTVLAKNGGTGAGTNVIVDFTTPQMADSASTTNSTATTFQSISAPGATCTTPAVGATGTVTCNVGTLSPGGSYQFTVTVNVPAVPGGWTSPVYVNEGTYDIKSDQTAVLNGGLVQTQITTNTPVDLQATLSDGVAAVTWGSPDVYTLVVQNNGPNAVTGATIVDSRPATLTGATWTCVGASGGVCGAASGSGNINTTANLPVGAKVTYTISTTVTGSGTGTITYSATATPPAGFVQSVAFHNVGSDTDNAAASLFTLTVNKDPASTGTGVVVTSPAAISCGVGCTTANAKFTNNTFVSVSAVAPPGQTFIGWSGACTGLTNPCNLTITADTSLTARFDAPTVAGTISTTSNGGSANVRPGDTIDYSVTLSVPYNNNSGVTVNDVFPSGLSYVSSTAPTTTGTVTCSVSGGCATPTVTTGATSSWAFGLVQCTTVGGCQISFHVTALVGTTVTRGSTLVNVVGGTGITNANLPTATVIEPNLTIARSPSPATNVARGAASTITVTLANNSGGANSNDYAAVVTLPTPANTTASGYTQGTCPLAVASFAGGNATFTFPAGSATLASGASCTFTYLLTVSNSAPGGATITAAAGAAASQSITGAAPPAKTYNATDAGFSFTVAKLANGIGCGSGAECTSAVCDTDSLCGYKNGDGPCNAGNATTVCRSGACSVSLVCEPAGGCEADGDCNTATQFCNTQTNLCVAKLTNGTSIPTITGHTPALTGACSALVGTSVCASGVCDTADNKCGFLNGDGNCNAGNATTVCRSQVCDADTKCGLANGHGACNAGNATTVCRSLACSVSLVCEPPGGCEVDSDCNTTTQFCNTQTNACVPKLTNGTSVPTITGHTPALTGACIAGVGASVCVSGVCDPIDNKCGLANGDGQCNAGNATTVCRSGACSTSLNCEPAGGCLVDNDCNTATQFCNTQTFACVSKLPNGTSIPTITGHTPALTGACSALVATTVCATGVCDLADNKCGVALGDGTCSVTAQCRAGLCISSGTNTGKCEPCGSDGDCSGATPACNTSTNQCVACTGSNSTACTGVTPICNTQNNTCTGCTANNGASSGSTCPIGAPYCNNATGACSSTCLRDSDCGSGNWCSAGSCVPLLPNGTPIPTVGGHSPALAGVCSTAIGAAICASGACDTADNKCGIAIGDGTCANLAQCRSGVCITGGANDAKCEPCATDATCSGATPACNTTTNQCVACTGTNATACAGVTPVCNTQSNVCVGCNGDNGLSVTHACPTAGAPFCAQDGSCGKCNGNTDCSTVADGGTSTHGGTICNVTSGACGSLCTADGDCTAQQWCDNPTAAANAGTCAPKIPNGQPVPSDAPISGVCTSGPTGAGTRACVSGTCDTGDNLCGEPNGRTCATAAVCRSNVCNADGKCGDPNGTTCTVATTCRSAVCDTDGKCGELNGEPCANPATCRSGYCVAADGICGELNGSPCVGGTDCRSNVCFTDSRCGLPNGQTCATGVVCRSGSCVSGVCSATCTQDTECPSGEYCNAGACTPDLANGQPCTRATQCTSNVCNADGKCGDPDGTNCTLPLTCRSGACSNGKCGTGCASDSDCPAADYCNNGACVPDLTNGTTCARSTQCLSDICETDNKCGEPNGKACAKPSVCRSGLCDATGTCGATCATDSDCAAGTWCDATTHTCAPSAPNGGQPTGKPCTRGPQCLSGVCDSDGSCGEINGETCGSPTTCRSSVCDPSNSTCGYVNSDGPCTPQNGTNVCQSGVCDNGNCGYANGDGPCTSNAQCRSAKCDTTSQKCAACLADSECPTGQFCDKPSGACKAQLTNGLPCDRATECVSAVCDPDGKCGKVDGEPCSGAAVCRSGQCTGGVCGSGATDAGADSGPQDAGIDATVNDAGKPDASVPADASTFDGGDAGDGLQIQGGGCNCSSTPGHDDEDGLALFGLVAFVAVVGARRRRPAA